VCSSIYPAPTRLDQCGFGGWYVNNCVHSEVCIYRCVGLRMELITGRGHVVFEPAGGSSEVACVLVPPLA
jgi:hypothetical protein